MAFVALKSFLLWIISTWEAIPARYKASVQALSPPPITATLLFLKNGPSQTAQYETPAPDSSFSPGMPSLLCSAPVATISYDARNSLLPAFTKNILFFLSIEETVA